MARTWRSTTTCAVLTVVVLLLGACTSDAGWAPTPPNAERAGAPDARPGTAAQWDLAVSADRGQVLGPLDPDASVRFLRLDRPGPVTAVTDRPVRDAGELTVPELVSLWGAGAFGEDPPNAILVLGGRPHPVELRAAVTPEDGSTVLFELRPLRRDDGRVVALPDPGAAPVALFIDAVEIDPEVTDAVTQTNVKVVGEAPAMAMGSLYQSIGTSTGLLFSDEQDPDGGMDDGGMDDVGMDEDGVIGLGSDDAPPPGITAQEWAALTAG